MSYTTFDYKGRKILFSNYYPDDGDNGRDFYESTDSYVDMTINPPIVIEAYVYNNIDENIDQSFLNVLISYRKFNNDNHVIEFHQTHMRVDATDWEWYRYRDEHLEKYILPLFDAENPRETMSTYAMEETL